MVIFYSFKKCLMSKIPREIRKQNFTSTNQPFPIPISHAIIQSVHPVMLPNSNLEFDNPTIYWTHNFLLVYWSILPKLIGLCSHTQYSILVPPTHFYINMTLWPGFLNRTQVPGAGFYFLRDTMVQFGFSNYKGSLLHVPIIYILSRVSLVCCVTPMQ